MRARGAAMVLIWSGPPVTQEEIAAQVYTPGRAGTLQSDMVAGARRHGRLAVPVTRLSDLTAELVAGHPVVVFQVGFRSGTMPSRSATT